MVTHPFPASTRPLPEKMCQFRNWIVILMTVGATGSALAANEKEIKIGTLHGQMKYDVDSFQVKPGAKVTLVFNNDDEMQHNLLILTPGEEKIVALAQRAWAMGADAVKKQFVPDGPEVLFHTRVLDPGENDTITFTAPATEGDYPYVCTLPGHIYTMRGKMHVSKVEAPTVMAQKPDKPAAGSNKHVHVMDEPKVIRAFVDGGPPRSISVGLPGGVNYLFDADQCYVRFGWTGMFLDVGPNVGKTPGDRGGGWCEILGDKFELGDSGFPISVGTRDANQKVEFAGYRMRGKEAPEFLITIDGKRVTQVTRPAPDGTGLQMDFEFEQDPGKVFFYVSPHGLTLSSSAGTWHDGRLDLTDGQGKKFSVTIVREASRKNKRKTPTVDP